MTAVSGGLGQQPRPCLHRHGRGGGREPATGALGSLKHGPGVRSLAVAPQVEEPIAEERTL